MGIRALVRKDCQGQSLLEAVLMMPLMLGVVLNAVNLGYFFFVTVNLSAATRSAAEYSVIGPGSPGTTAYPPACSTTAVCPGTGPNVTDLLYQDLTGAVANAASAIVRVCSASLGTSGSPAVSNCVVCTSATSCSATSSPFVGTPSADPEAAFVLNRIDVKYSFRPLVPGTIFNLILATSAYAPGTGQYTFYRHVDMRAM